MHEILNGLARHEDLQEEALKIPIGVIPAGVSQYIFTLLADQLPICRIRECTRKQHKNLFYK
jgi:hypothetical protein